MGEHGVRASCAKFGFQVWGIRRAPKARELRHKGADRGRMQEEGAGKGFPPPPRMESGEGAVPPPQKIFHLFMSKWRILVYTCK